MRSLLVVGGLATQACNLGEGYADFGNDLTSPEETIIDGPGNKISDVRLSGMLVDPWGDDGAVVVGFRYRDGVPHLYMQPFDGSKGCDVGPAYRCIVFNRLDGAPQLIAYLDAIQSNGRGTLNFVNHECEIVYGGIENAELPSRLFEFPPGYVIAAGDELLDLDPFSKTTRVMTKNLRFWSGPGEPNQELPHYYVGDGELVVFDDERKEQLRLGKDVTEVVFEASDYTRGLFLVDEGALVHYYPSRDVPPETLDDDVCGARIESFGVSYFSPCGERRLVMRNMSTSEKTVIDSNVRRSLYSQERSRSDGSGTDVEAVYTKVSEEDPGFEDFWLKQAGKEPRIWQRRLGQFISATTGENPSLVAIVDSDGSSGRLIRVDADGERTLLSNVALGYPVESSSNAWLVMTDVEDRVGTLTLVDSSGKTTVIGSRVPVGSKLVSPERDPYLDGVEDQDYYGLAALVTDVEEGRGSLNLMTRNKPKTIESIADDVPVGDFTFFKNMAAVGYLDRYDEKTFAGRLVVHQTTLSAKSVVADDVGDFSELLWPYEGVIYTARKGDKYSLWAARAK
ncbi:MAG: hypothetical protein QM784_25075 [Polyangiaceae bacterium]